MVENPADNSQKPLPPLPIKPELWRKIAKSMELSKQHSIAVEYVLRGMSDKEIEDKMEICHSTLRTYFDRIALRTGIRGRKAIHRHVLLAVARELNA
jgi:DNA-binding NarL/FixJ family response regulator